MSSMATGMRVMSLTDGSFWFAVAITNTPTMLGVKSNMEALADAGGVKHTHTGRGLAPQGHQRTINDEKNAAQSHHHGAVTAVNSATFTWPGRGGWCRGARCVGKKQNFHFFDFS